MIRKISKRRFYDLCATCYIHPIESGRCFSRWNSKIKDLEYYECKY